MTTYFSNYKFRCSSLGVLNKESKEAITEKQLETIAEFKQREKPLTNKQREELNRLLAKRDNLANKLGATCIEKLIEIYIDEVYCRRREIHSKYLEKGVNAEEDSLTLYSLVKGTLYIKNHKRLQNEYITGLPDTFDGTRGIEHADRVIDTKTCWHLQTFYAAKTKALNTDYKFQLHGYFPLTGASEGTIAYCLVNTPAHLIKQEKLKVYYAMNCPDEISDPAGHAKYIEACMSIERQMIFDMGQFRKDNPGFDIDTPDWNYDIPKHKRVHEVTIKREEAIVTSIYERVGLCRTWLNDFHYKESKILQTA